MDFENIVYQTGEGIATIRLNRPEKLNALSRGTWSDLHAALSAAEADDAVRVVILTGEGRAFSAGADIEEFGGLSESPVAVRAHIRNALTKVIQLETLAMPVIAAVNGLAMGGGFELAMASDIIVASEHAKFGLPEVRIGAVAAFAVNRLPRLVGSKKAMEIILSGDAIDAGEAYRLGLVNKVVPADQLQAEAINMAKRLLGAAPLAAAISKSLVNKRSGGREIEESITAAALCMGSKDLKEGYNAFMNKRPPVFTGH